MNELEALVQQKRELEKKIRALKDQSTKYGLAKVDVEHYPTLKPDRHYLAIYYEPLNNGRKKWQTIFSANSRQEVVDVIPGIIGNLQSLYNVLVSPEEEADG